MFSSLKKLFGGKPEGEHPSSPATAPQARGVVASAASFLRSEAVFDRNNRLVGRLFCLRESNILANAEPATQRGFDEALLDTLNASKEAWNTSLAFLPLSSASLDLPAVHRLKTENIVLLLQLAADAEPNPLCEAIEALRQRGLKIGIFRQPRHPAFAKAIRMADCAAIDISACEPNTVRDFSAAIRSTIQNHPIRLLACNVETPDDHQFCRQWHFENFHGGFAAATLPPSPSSGGDPHKAQLLNLMRLVEGDAETTEIAAAMRQDPLLSFRILRYLNSPALGLTHRIDSLEQALIILGRQRLTRWLAVLLFSVRSPTFSDWLLVENALTRGRLMEVLGRQLLPGHAHDALFLTGIFSCLDRLLRRPLTEILDDMLLADDIRLALLERRGPYAPLLAVAEAGEHFDLPRMAAAARAANVDPGDVNQALLAATAWASEVTEYWE